MKIKTNLSFRQAARVYREAFICGMSAEEICRYSRLVQSDVETLIENVRKAREEFKQQPVNGFIFYPEFETLG